MSITIVPYTAHDATAVKNLISSDVRVHSHISWHSIETWLSLAREPSILVYDAQKRLRGAILYTPPVAGYVWMRVVVLHNSITNADARSLFQFAEHHARQQGIHVIAVLDTEPWLEHILRLAGYRIAENIVHFQRQKNKRVRPLHSTTAYMIRDATPTDFEGILLVDHAAFDMLWQLHDYDLNTLMKNTLSLTVAVDNEQIMGYQLSTSHYQGVHLTRLAVLPSIQRQGIASSLVGQLITRFPNRTISVNTQQSNQGSRRFYERFGFELVNYRTPVWQKEISST